MTQLPLLLVVLLLAGSLESRGDVRDIVGYWYSEELDKSTISIYPVAEGLWHARIVASANKGHIGKELLSGLRLLTTKNEYAGTLTSPKNDMDVDATVFVVADGRLRVTGKRLFFKKTYFWAKVKTPPL